MLTIKKIEKAIAAIGGQEKLARTKDSFYFYEGKAAMWYTSVVAVYRLNHLTLEQWVQRYKNLRDCPLNTHFYDTNPTTTKSHMV